MKRRVFSILLVMTLTAGMLMSCSQKNDEVVGSDADSKKNNLKIVDVLLTDEYYGIGVDKDEPELLEEINSFIEEGLSNGTYDEITSHYFDSDKKPVPVYSAKLDESKDQFVVATTGDFEPFDYDEDDAFYGIDKELIKAIADHLGKELVLVNVNFDIIFTTVYQKKCDACIAGITIKKEREKYVNFSVPYFNAGQCLAVRDDNTDFENAKTREDVEKILLSYGADKTIVVEGETSGEDYLIGNDSGGFPGVSCKIYKVATLYDALEKLSNGEADCVIGDAAVLKYIVANHYGK